MLIMDDLTSKRDQLVLSHQDLLHHFAHKLVSSHLLHKNDYDECICAGNLFLLVQAGNYDESKGTKFITYIYTYLYLYMKDWCLKTRYFRVIQGTEGGKRKKIYFQVDKTIGNFDAETRERSNTKGVHVLEKPPFLTVQEWTVCLHLMESYTQAEISNLIGLTRQRVSQIVIRMRQKFIDHWNIIPPKTEDEI